MVTPESIKRDIEEELTCDLVQVEGDGQHFEAVIVSAAFQGKSRCSAISSSTRRSAIACARRSTPCRCSTLTPEQWRARS